MRDVTFRQRSVTRTRERRKSGFERVERQGVRQWFPEALVSGLAPYSATSDGGRAEQQEPTGSAVNNLELAEQGRPAGWPRRRVGAYGVRRRRSGRHGPFARAVLWSRVAGLREHGADSSGRTLGQLRLAVWKAAPDVQPWDQLRGVCSTRAQPNAHPSTRYLLTGRVDCGACGARLLSRPRDDHTKRYLYADHRRRAGRRAGGRAGPGSPRDGLGRAALLAQAGQATAPRCGHTGGPGSGPTPPRVVDDDYYVRGALSQGGFDRSAVKLEREIDRLQRTNAQKKDGK